MRILIYIISFFLSVIQVFGQYENRIWHFGTNGGGMNFDLSNNISFNSSYNPTYTSTGSTMVVNPLNGNLFFYTDGKRIYDSGHLLMPGATYPLLGGNATHSSGWAVHDPGDCNKYYVFSITTATEGVPIVGNLYYTKVDMSLPGHGTIASPQGEVVSSQVNVLLSSNVGEGLQIIPIPGSHEYWAVCSVYSSSELRLFRISTSGVSFITSFFPGITLTDVQAMRFNPQGTKLFLGSFVENQPCVLIDFNPTTGVFSNVVTIPGTPLGTSSSQYAGIVDAEWSSDGTKVYFSKFRNTLPIPGGGKLYQYDLNAPLTPPYLVYSVSNNTNEYSEGLRRGSDDKIYHSFNNALNSDDGLGAINNPNLAGAACNYNPTQVSLPQSYGGVALLPYSVQVNNTLPDFSDDTIQIFSCNNSIYSYYVLPILNDYEGDLISFSVTYNGPGSITQSQDTIYYSGVPSATMDQIQVVYCDDYCNALCDTFQIVFEINSATNYNLILNDTIQGCNGSTVNISVSGGFSSVVWSNGATTSSINVTNSGQYTVSASDSLGCQYSDTVHVVFLQELNNINLGQDSIFCSGTSFNTTLSVGPGYSPVIWNNGSTTNNIIVTDPGLYWVIAYDANGCLDRDSIVFTEANSSISQMPDSISNNCGSVTLNPDVPGAQYVWSNGSLAQELNVTVSGVYWVLINVGNGCLTSDTVVVTVNGDTSFFEFIPNVFSPNNDGVNDYFQISGNPNECVDLIKVEIYDRWGLLVFNSEDLDFKWDGKTENGLICSEGVYFVLIKGNYSGNILEYYSSLSLFR